jgi:hypothetical protein
LGKIQEECWDGAHIRKLVRHTVFLRPMWRWGKITFKQGKVRAEIIKSGRLRADIGMAGDYRRIRPKRGS